MKKEPVYKTYPRFRKIYYSMIERCENPNNPGYKNYGGRGIALCDEWRNDIRKFIQWSLNNGYKPGLTIDRIDVNGGYSPENCRWATYKDQSLNKTNTIKVEYRGENKTLCEWCEILGLDYRSTYVKIRYNLWSVEEAFNPDNIKNIKRKYKYFYDGKYISLSERNEIIQNLKEQIDAFFVFYESAA